MSLISSSVICFLSRIIRRSSSGHTKNIITYQVENYTISGDNKGRQTLENIGNGTGWYITEGYAVPITWEKSSRSSKTIYKYLDGTEIKVNDGNTYIEIQPSSKNITIE